MKTAQDFQRCATRLKALADPDRLRIVTCLLEGDTMNVGEIAAELGEDIVKISHHLGVLRHADIVTTERQGRFMNYSLHEGVTFQNAKGARWIEFGCCRVELGSCER